MVYCAIAFALTDYWTTHLRMLAGRVIVYRSKDFLNQEKQHLNNDKKQPNMQRWVGMAQLQQVPKQQQ